MFRPRSQRRGWRPKQKNPPFAELIPWLLNENRQLRGIPFSEVIADATGKKVLPFDGKNEVNQRVAKQISAALDEVVKRMNAPDSPIQNISRINELSSHFEDMIRELLSATPGLNCDLPQRGPAATEGVTPKAFGDGR